jgi:hypothetical protein
MKTLSFRNNFFLEVLLEPLIIIFHILIELRINLLELRLDSLFLKIIQIVHKI